MNCSACQQPLPEGSKFCMACGASVAPLPAAQPMPIGQSEKKKYPWWVFLLAGVGCLVVAVPILGVITAITIPNILTLHTRGQVAACSKAMKGMRTAFEVYYIDHETFPSGFQEFVTPRFYLDLPKVMAGCEAVFFEPQTDGLIKILNEWDYLVLARPKGMSGKDCWLIVTETGIQYTAACRMGSVGGTPVKLDSATLRVLSRCPGKGWVRSVTCLGQ